MGCLFFHLKLLEHTKRWLRSFCHDDEALEIKVSFRCLCLDFFLNLRFRGSLFILNKIMVY